MPKDERSRSVARSLTPAVLIAILALCSCQTGSNVADSAGASSSSTTTIAEIRSSHSLPPLTADSTLERAALQQARYMADAGRMVHTTGRGRDFATRMSENDVSGTAAENIAQGRMDRGRLFAMWMASPPHRKNMLDPRMNKFGLASAQGKADGQRYWALVLSK